MRQLLVRLATLLAGATMLAAPVAAASAPTTFAPAHHAVLGHGVNINGYTRGWTFTTSQTLSSRRVSAEVIIESPTGAYPNFGTISFTGATLNGNSFSTYSPTALDPSNGVYEAHTGALSGGNFSIAYEHE